MSTTSPRLTCKRSAATTAVELRICARRATITPVLLRLARVWQPTDSKTTAKNTIVLLNLIPLPSKLFSVTERTQQLLLFSTQVAADLQLRLPAGRTQRESIRGEQLLEFELGVVFNVQLSEAVHGRGCIQQTNYSFISVRVGSDTAAKQLSITIRERGGGSGFLPELQIVEEGDQHPFHVNLIEAAGPTRLGCSDQRNVVRVRNVDVVRARECLEKTFEVDDPQLERGAQGDVHRKAFEEPVVIACQLERIGHPQMQHFVSEDDLELPDPRIEVYVRIDEQHDS